MSTVEWHIYNTKVVTKYTKLTTLDWNTMDDAWFSVPPFITEKIDVDGFEFYLKDTQNTICGRHPISVFLQALRNTSPTPSVAFTRWEKACLVMYCFRSLRWCWLVAGTVKKLCLFWIRAWSNTQIGCKVRVSANHGNLNSFVQHTAFWINGQWCYFENIWHFPVFDVFACKNHVQNFLWSHHSEEIKNTTDLKWHSSFRKHAPFWNSKNPELMFLPLWTGS